MFKDLIEYSHVEEASEECFGFSDVTFLRDFGPWKKGDEVECMWFDIDDKATAREVDDEGNTIKECNFQLTALV